LDAGTGKVEQGMPIKVVTQTTLIEGKSTKRADDNWMDDCGVTSAGMALQYASKGEITVTPQEAWDAGRRAGRKDVDGEGNGTSAHELIATVKQLGGYAQWVPAWAAAKRAAAAGAAIVVNVEAPLGIPKRVWSEWQKKRAANSAPYGHWCVLAREGGAWEYADPTMSGKGKEVYGKAISEQEADGIARSKTLVKKTPIWIAVYASKPAPKTPVKPPQKPVAASKPAAPIKTAPIVVKTAQKEAVRAKLASALKETKRTPWGAAQRALWNRVSQLQAKLRKK
jgi:hypothetical protein